MDHQEGSRDEARGNSVSVSGWWPAGLVDSEAVETMLSLGSEAQVNENGD